MPLAAIPLGAWIAGAAVAGAGASVYGANKASSSSQKATDQTLALNAAQASQARQDALPYTQAGYGAVNAITSRLGLGGQPAANAAPAGGGMTADLRIAADVAGGYYQPGAYVDGYGVIGPDSVSQAQAALNGGGSPPATAPATAVTTAAPNINAITGAPSGAPTADPGTYGSVANPTYTAPEYTAPDAFQFSGDDYKNSDAYKFQLERGTEAIRAKQAYMGALDSGDTGKELATFSQGLASQGYADERAFARTSYDSDRAFGRNTFDTDRSADRAIYTDNRDYLTGRSDTQTGNLFNLAQLGQASAAGSAANSAASTGTAINAITSNASNKINAGLATTQNVNNLIGQGVNAAAYYYR